MRTTLAIAATGLLLTGCTQPSYATTKLDCPSKQGELSRVSISDDGKTCAYRSSDGAQVNLELIPVVGGPEATLAKIETELRATPGDGAANASEVNAMIAEAARAKADVAAISAEAARIRDEAIRDAGAKVSISGGDKDGGGRIDLPGVHISESGDGGQVQIGPLKVDSDSDDTTVNIYRNVRMRGEALSREKRGLRATFIYTGDDLPADYRYVGYEAGGPRSGPLTVAKVRSKVDAESGDKIYHDVQELVRRNGGV
ncbi:MULTISPECIES: hypothetical protein [Phenylobacterium]|uniref:Methyltransferase type 11 n=1 Tax=Phenylobacterium koreense TaxID=266125 RepID=A0ABV2EDP3_9CAUL